MATLLVIYAWAKKYWQLLVTLIIGLFGLLVGVEVKKRPIIVQGEDPLKKKVESQVSQQIQVAQVAHDEVVSQAEQQATQEQTSVVQQEEATTQKVEADVDATNAYLQGVSKDIQGKT